MVGGLAGPNPEPSCTATHPRDETGSVTVWMLLVPLLVLALGGIGADLWTALATRSQLAAIADDAAAAGVGRVDDLVAGQPVVDEGLARQRVTDYLRAHPRSGDVLAWEVATLPGGLRVSLRGSARMHLLRLVGAGEVALQVTASAAPAVRQP